MLRDPFIQAIKGLNNCVMTFGFLIFFMALTWLRVDGWILTHNSMLIRVLNDSFIFCGVDDQIANLIPSFLSHPKIQFYAYISFNMLFMGINVFFSLGYIVLY